MKKLLLIPILFFAGYIASAQHQAMDRGSYYCSHKKQQQESLLRSPLGPNSPEHKFDVLKYTIDINLYNNFNSPYPHDFTATNIVEFKVDTALNQIKLNANNSSLNIQNVSLAGTAFTHQNDTLYINLDQTYEPGDTVEVMIDYEHLNVNDQAFYAGNGFVFTDCEPQGARRWFPNWDSPADKAALDLTAKVPYGVLLGSNGYLADSVSVADTTWFHWVSDNPVATYLMVMSAKWNWNLDIVYWNRPSGDRYPYVFTIMMEKIHPISSSK